MIDYDLLKILIKTLEFRYISNLFNVLINYVIYSESAQCDRILNNLINLYKYEFDLIFNKAYVQIINQIIDLIQYI